MLRPRMHGDVDMLVSIGSLLKISTDALFSVPLLLLAMPIAETRLATALARLSLRSSSSSEVNDEGDS